MDPRDDDIQFDFFEDEPPTTEAPRPGRGPRLPRRGGGGTPPRRAATGPPHGLTPLLRLLAVIAIVVALLVFFGLVIQSCASTSKHDEYKHYVDKVAVIANSSTADGASLARAFVTPGAKAGDVAGKLNGIAEQERLNAAAAARLDAPGPLRSENQQLVEALQLRVSGTGGLAQALQLIAGTKSPKIPTEAATLAEQADRLLASDVVYDDLFLGPAKDEMDRRGVSGVRIPESHYVANRDLVTERSMAELLQRLRTTTTGGVPAGLHGTNIVDVKALPGSQTLSTKTLNTVTANTSLAFAVSIADSGDSQEVGIKVTLTIQQNPPITKTQTLQVINPGQTKTVTFSNVGQVQFARRVNVNVDVAPVPGEHNTDNNKASFPVIFSLG